MIKKDKDGGTLICGAVVSPKTSLVDDVLHTNAEKVTRIAVIEDLPELTVVAEQNTGEK